MDKDKDRRLYVQSETKKRYLGILHWFYHCLYLFRSLYHYYHFTLVCPGEGGRWLILLGQIVGNDLFQKQSPSQILVFREQTLTGAIMGPFWVRSSFPVKKNKNKYS